MSPAARRSAWVGLAAVVLAGCSATPPASTEGRSAERLKLGFDDVKGDPGLVFEGGESYATMAWADLDGDGWLDLATGPGQGSLDAPDPGGGRPAIYANLDTELVPHPLEFVEGVIGEAIPGLAWADYDGDGDSDLAIGYHSVRLGVDNDLALRDGSLVLLENQDGTLVRAFESAPEQAHRTHQLDWADLEHDARPELAEATEAGLWLWRNLDSAPTAELLVDGWFSDVEWADLDGDGWIDLTAASDQGVVLIPNTGGTLDVAGRGMLLEGTPVARVTWGDWIGNGLAHPALIAEAEARVFENFGDTAFQNRKAWSRLQTEPWSIAWADLDSDGDLDLAIGWEDGTVEVLENFESFTGRLLETAWEDGDGLNAVTVVTPGDWDGDGDPDLAVGRGEADSTYRASGIYRSLASAIGDEETPLTGVELSLVADWDGDGDQDVIASYNVTDLTGTPSRGHGVLFVAPNGPDGLQLPEVFPGLEFPRSTEALDSLRVLGMALADRDLDGDPDLGLATNQGIVHVENREGALIPAWFEPNGTLAIALAYADVDQDGDLDLAAWSGSALRLLENDRGTYVELWSQPLGAPEATQTGMFNEPSGTLTFASLDGDGRLQLVAAGGLDVDLYVLDAVEGDPSAPWRRRDFHPPILATQAWAADLDDDGRDELLVAGEDDFMEAEATPERILDIQGNRAEALWERQSSIGTDLKNVDFADVDGDEILDFVAGYSNQLLLFTHQGDTWVPDGEATSNDVVWPAASFIDHDGDGDPDILWHPQLVGVARGAHLGSNGRGGSDLLASNPPRIALRWTDGFQGARFSEGDHRTLEQGPVELTVTVFDKERDPVPPPRFEFRDWGGGWRPAAVTGLPERLESAPLADGGHAYTASWDWAADGADGEDVQVRAILSGFSQSGGELRSARATATTHGRRLFLDTDGDGVRQTTDQCPDDPDDDALIPGVCDSRALANGWWCNTGGSGAGGWPGALVVGLLAAGRRRAAPRTSRDA